MAERGAWRLGLIVPGMRLFRQKACGDWSGVFDDMARALKDLFQSRETC